MSVSSLLDPAAWPKCALIFIGGAWIGRALGALIQRFLQTAGYPSSHYYRLGAARGWFSHLPVFGHLVGSSGTRCRRALNLELLTGGAFLACWLLFPPAKAFCGCVFLLGLIGASYIDFDHMVIPDLFTIGLALVGLALSATVPALHGTGHFSKLACLRSEAAGILGLAIGSSFGLWIGLIGEWILDKEILGFGDVKFLGAIGAFCGWQGAVFSVFGGAVVGLIALIGGELHRRYNGAHSVQLFRLESSGGETGKLAWGAHFPFGPMLATAAGLYFLVLHPAVDRYLAQYLALF
jgi:leader peptidase (prepilin peptidase) / N-methyltransferase